ncbi:MAG TPA: DUF6691 family protein [Chitinophagales bacterium]|nr:DUF6691 family protein [Chitinophagales bacterium]
MIKYFFIGMLFGLALVKGEAVSWYRMQEMFHFQGFQIFGIFMTAVPVAALGVWLFKRFNVTSADGTPVQPRKKLFNKGTVFGSALFGIGWGLTGACPGPIYIQIGAGYWVSIVLLLSALGGTWTYAFFRSRLPH